MTLQKIVSLRDSAEVATATTDTGTAVKLQDAFRELIVTLTVSAAATDVDDTLDVYVDTSFDGGTTWINIGHFTQVLGNGGAKKYQMAWANSAPPAAANSVDVSADQAEGASIQRGFGDNLRYRGVTVDPSGTNIAITYAVSAFLKK